MRGWRTHAAMALAGAVVAACGGGPASTPPGAGAPGASTMIVGLDTMRFNPETVTVKAGQPVKVTFRNGGLIAHDLVSEGAVRNVKLANVGAGKSQEGVFLAEKPGTYRITCPQPGHTEAGMVGKIVVE